MRRTVATALSCLLLGTALAGCTDSAPKKQEEERSARQLLDEANETMAALDSVTVTMDTAMADGTRVSGQVTTDLKRRCTGRTDFGAGKQLDEIRIDDTGYFRPNRAYLKEWAEERGLADVAGRKPWVKAVSDGARGITCTREFAFFGEAKKGKPGEVDGVPTIALVVTDEADEGGTYAFHVATEGEPYLLKVAYEGTDHRNTTTFSGFDAPLDVRAPAPSEVVDATARR
ncbi:hypothetical protein ACFWIA_20235 [Streptomyces sp. NPDC127068]|uniref:hypothetical protein n=1 Tax=Streptomyces sp. NPDC127068 TaxID=3347127 RepID=UPI00364D5F29